MKVKKYLNPSSPLTKKKRRLFYFTPEQEKLFNLVTVPGTNVNSNTTVNAARKTGVQALNFLAQEAARKDAEIEARSDRKTVKRLTTVGERLRGDNGYSSYMSAGTPMSGRDPALGTIFDWTVGAKGIDALGKTALWNYAKYAPKTMLGNWGKGYFTNQALKEGIKDFGRNLSNRLYIENAGKYTLFNQFGDDIGTLLTTKPLTSEAKGKGIAMVASKNGGHKVSEDLYNIAVLDSKELGYQGLESGHDLFRPNLTMHVTDKFPKVEWPNVSLLYIDGKYLFAPSSTQPPIRLLTGTTERPQPNFIQELTNHRIDLGALRNLERIKFNEATGNFEEIPTVSAPEPPTSLAFFERRPVNNLTSHVQGEEAVKMFKEYGGEPIPEGSINGEQLRKYVPEARERYGLVGNNNITDEEIAQALYKHSKELGGNTAAVNALGEPLLLFRGDTHRYTQLKERMSPEELAKKSGTMDNSLGTLFLEDPALTSRYLISASDFQGTPRISGSSTGAKGIINGETVGKYEGVTGKLIPEIPEEAIPLATYHPRFGDYTLYKLPGKYSETGISDLNAFVVRTPEVRNATSEISVLSDDFLSLQPQFKGKFKIEHPDAKTLEERQAMAKHYRYVLDDAEKKNQGLLKSDANSKFRDEHESSAYYTLPNFNIGGAKHLLPYDLRIPRNWEDRNIYRGLLPFLGLGTASTLYSKKQGGKITINNIEI